MTTLPPSFAVVMKSVNLNFLEPSGPLQACNGTANFLSVRVNSVLLFNKAECNLCLTSRYWQVKGEISVSQVSD